MDLLQTLRSKIPMLVDKMMAGRVFKEERYAPIAKTGARILARKKWDPANSTVATHKLVN